MKAFEECWEKTNGISSNKIYKDEAAYFWKAALEWVLKTSDEQDMLDPDTWPPLIIEKELER